MHTIIAKSVIITREQKVSLACKLASHHTVTLFRVNAVTMVKRRESNATTTEAEEKALAMLLFKPNNSLK